jgi:hypothetical protein
VANSGRISARRIRRACARQSASDSVQSVWLVGKVVTRSTTNARLAQAKNAEPALRAIPASPSNEPADVAGMLSKTIFIKIAVDLQGSTATALSGHIGSLSDPI